MDAEVDRQKDYIVYIRIYKRLICIQSIICKSILTKEIHLCSWFLLSLLFLSQETHQQGLTKTSKRETYWENGKVQAWKRREGSIPRRGYGGWQQRSFWIPSTCFGLDPCVIDDLDKILPLDWKVPWLVRGGSLEDNIGRGHCCWAFWLWCRIVGASKPSRFASFGLTVR